MIELKIVKISDKDRTLPIDVVFSVFFVDFEYIQVENVVIL